MTDQNAIRNATQTCRQTVANTVRLQSDILFEQRMTQLVRSRGIERERTAIRVLLVEDSAVDAEIVTRRLKRSHRFDVTLTHCPTVAEAERAMVTGTFDVMVVDYWLDAGHSVDLLRRCELPDLPIVLLTGSDLRVIEDEAFEAGVVACASKDDMTGGTLDSTLSNALRGHERARRERGRVEAIVAGALAARAAAGADVRG